MSVRRPTDGGIGSVATPSRYDLLLALLPVPLLVGALVTTLFSVPEPLGIGAGAVPSALLLGYALFGAVPTATVRSG
jgi:hypothetical protein